jgi:chromosome segregation ATPase
MELSLKIDGIDLKVRQLALKLEQLQRDHALLMQENHQLKAETIRYQEVVATLKNKLSTTQQAMETRGEETTEKLRQQIDLYIGEIDKCIEWLYNN